MNEFCACLECGKSFSVNNVNQDKDYCPLCLSLMSEYGEKPEAFVKISKQAKKEK